MNNLKLKRKLSLVLVPTIVLVIGFIFGEDLSTGGAQMDFIETFPAILNFSNLNLSDYHLHTRHFPFHYMMLSIPQRMFENIFITKICYLIFSFLAPFFIYLNLNILYPKNKFNNLIISFSILLIPYFRVSAIWPNAHLTALIFLLISNYYFLLFQLKKKKYQIFLNLLLLSFSTYSVQSYSIFFIYYLYEYFKIKKNNEILLILFLCFIFSLPGFYLLFTTPLAEKLQFSSNFSYTLLTNSSIIFFFLIFFISNNKTLNIYVSFLKNLNLVEIFILTLMFFFMVFSFQTPSTAVGGGFFYKISIFLFNSKYLFFLICFISIFTLYLTLKINKNLFYVIFLTNLTAIAYFTSQKYFEPLLILIIFTFFRNFLTENLITNTRNVYNYYIILIIYFLIAQVNSIYKFSVVTSIS